MNAVDAAQRARREVVLFHLLRFHCHIAVCVRAAQQATRAGVDLMLVDVERAADEAALEWALHQTFLEHSLREVVHVFVGADLPAEVPTLAAGARRCLQGDLALLFCLLQQLDLAIMLHEAGLTEQVPAHVDEDWATWETLADRAHEDVRQLVQAAVLLETALERQSVRLTVWQALRQRRHTMRRRCGRGGRGRHTSL